MSAKKEVELLSPSRQAGRQPATSLPQLCGDICLAFKFSGAFGYYRSSMSLTLPTDRLENIIGGVSPVRIASLAPRRGTSFKHFRVRFKFMF
jgi:hypothetical protein